MNEQYRREGWRSWALHPITLVIFLLFDLGFAIGLFVLSSISSSHSGIVSITNETFVSLGSSWNLALLWTTLPNLLFRLLGIFWDCIAAATIDRQPFTELRRPGGAKAGRSILLDYRTSPAPLRWAVAFKNRHFLVGVVVLLCFLLSLVVTPLSAHLFVLHEAIYTSNTTVLLNTVFNESGINSSTDWKRIFDTVAATRIYQGGAIPWTNNEFAFQNFSLPPTLPTSSGSLNLTIDTTAYSAYLDCQSLTGYQLQLSNTNANNTEGHVSLSATDRGCDVVQEFVVASIQPVYFKTTSEISCSAATYFSRLVFTAGTYSQDSPSLMANLSVISCIPGYAATPGALTIANGLSQRPEIVSFKRASPEMTRPTLWRVFEQNLFNAVSFNPNTEWSTTDFGSVVLYYASSLNPSSYLATDNLILSIRTIFTSIYLTAVATEAFQVTQPPETTTAIATSAQSRLYIIPWVAYTIASILIICGACLIWTWHYTNNHPSILMEEPSGMLSYAGILHHSILNTVVADDVCSKDNYDGKFVKRAKERWDFNEAVCSVAGDGPRALVQVENLRLRGNVTMNTEVEQ
ncbi:hypothetical protein BGZ57DRAFT_768907 [Hyaloscypha finlandica]|nr:hypothetical protein BGZ57DRAFT_768907 [Hyaloscypha finlandica]